ncbi:hypothetical protein CsatB_018546 [Cannabis sativa]|uniref:Activator of Hsp90 ATPase AHSA1-like N-terminal domain-containing protein n=2 Tax=Cannabis sativa TaxID=3483 RepID=A0AB40E4Y4_CANSA|nr:hypothetical protein G4B88_009379 [Cannabis sativa]KAF4365604.1 hypothetical protein F8388_007437 [Cannabis sativa]KAF4390450.1 hypothetical protein G4B88_024456 [Cannabis sativa]
MEEEGQPLSSSSSEKKTQQEAPSSYTYWVRGVTNDAVPLPAPRKLTSNDILSSNSAQPTTQLGSVWNRAGTWEEKNLNSWATQRIKELVMTVDSLELSAGKAQISDLSKCAGDAFLVTVRNKKRVGYTYEITLNVKGEWIVGEEKKTIKGYLEIPEFSFGELDELQVEVKLSEEKDFSHQDKMQIKQDLKQFLQPVREKLLQFEQELKDR